MILNKISFKNVKRNENILNNAKLKINAKVYHNMKPKETNCEYNVINDKANINNNLKSNMLKSYKRNNSHSKINNTYSISNYFIDNVNNIISYLKNPNRKTEQSTDFSSSIINTNNNISSNCNKALTLKKNKTYFTLPNKMNKRKDIKFFYEKRGKSATINDNFLGNYNFSTLLEKLKLKREEKRNIKSSVQIPYIIKENKINCKYKYIGLYNSNKNKDNTLKKEINNLMRINQQIKFRKSKSFNSNDNSFIPLNYKRYSINSIKDRGNSLNININFCFQRKKDEFIGKNRLLMKQNYFNNLLKEKKTKAEIDNRNNKRKIKNIDNKINNLQIFINYFKINNIINKNLRLLYVIYEKNEYKNSKLLKEIKNYNNEIINLKIYIRIHNDKRNEIFSWYELLCKIKGDIPLETNNNNFNEIVNSFAIEDLSKGFNYLAEKIIVGDNKYKNIRDEIFTLKNIKEQMNQEYKLLYEKGEKEIKKNDKELIILKGTFQILDSIKNNVMNRKVIDLLDLKKNHLDKYSIYLKRHNKKIVIVKKVIKIFGNYLNYLKNNDYFSLEEKGKIKKLEKEVIQNYKKLIYVKKEKIKSYILEIFYIIEKLINFLIFDINHVKKKIGKEKFKKIMNNYNLRGIENQFMLSNYTEDINEETNYKNDKIIFLPIKKVYTPFYALKKEIMNHNKIYIKKEKNKSVDDKNEKKKTKTKQSLFYMDDSGRDKYKELLFE